MKINVEHVAKLANLPLKETEIEKFESQLSSILDYFKKLSEVNTSKILETSQTTGLVSVTKEDTIHDSLSQEEALSNTKNIENGMVKVPAVFEEQ